MSDVQQGETSCTTNSSSVDVPPAKIARIGPSPNTNGDLKISSLEAKVVLTSDAYYSEDKLLASQLSKQPVKIWYSRKYDSECQDGHNDPDSPINLMPTGGGTMAAILDSGINKDHMAFQGIGEKISRHSQSFVGGDISDRLGHGTQCAGLLCGSPAPVLIHDTNDTMMFEGSATGAKVLVCKVVEDGSNIASIDAVCRAIDFIIQHNRDCVIGGKDERVDVISLSFGATVFHHELTQKIQEALCDNIIVVCAASNSGMKSRQPITYPGRLGHVLCIGACNDSGKPTSFTPVGREIDFLAPGENLWAPTIGSETSFCAVSGTSFATPSLAGVVCQILEDLRELSSRTGEQRLLPLMCNVWCIRELLKTMATTQGRHSDEIGYGRLEPLDYFEKTDDEKMRMIRKVLQQ